MYIKLSIKIITSVLIYVGTSTAAISEEVNYSNIGEASHAFDNAQFKKDGKMLDHFLTDDFIFIRSSGKFTGRAEFISVFTDPEITYDEFIISERQVLKYGDNVAIVTAECFFIGTNNGASVIDHFRYSDTFELRDGEWKVVYVQSTSIPKRDQIQYNDAN